MNALTPFVGRTADLVDLERTLEASRWVAVVGPPGVGKTRLVDELVRSMIERDIAAPGGVWRIDLGGVGSMAEAIATIATELGIAADRGPAIAGVAAVLANRGPMLVVLHETDGVARDLGALVEPLLADVVHLQFITTGRSRSGVHGEACFDVHPLSIDEAVELFAERARSVRRGFSLDGSLAEVRQLVEALDRLPLAVELAAARVRVLTVAQLAATPGDMLGTGRDRVRVALDTTWDALADWQRAALAQLAVFRGGFDLEAATAVLDLREHASAPPVVDVLASLCDASLVLARAGVSTMRFDLLSVIRDYVVRRLDAPGATVRHARHWIPLARTWIEQIDGRASRCARDRLREERANLVAIVERGAEVGVEAALSAAICIATAQLRAGAYRELADCLAQPLATAGERVPGLRAEAWWLAGEIARQIGDLDRAADCYGYVRALGERLDDTRMLARAGYGMAAIAFSRGDFVAAAAGYRDLAAAAPPTIEPVCLTRALSDLGVILTVIGDTTNARLAFDRALREAVASECEIGAGRALLGLGQLEHRAGRLDDALRWLERARAIHDAVGDRRSVAMAHQQLGLNHHLRGRLAEAAACYRDALATCDEIGHRLLTALVVSALGVCVHAEGRLDEAARLLEDGRAAFVRFHPAYYAVDTARLAAVWADRGDVDAARALLSQAREALPERCDPEVSETITSCAIHIDLAGGADPSVARARIAAAEDAHVDVRLQAIALARRLDGAELLARRLDIGARYRWFALDRGDRIAIDRRGPPSRILARLVEHRLSEPGGVVKTHALFDHGWPDQRASPASAAQRVYTAIWTLRKLGLRDVIVRVAEGYFLDPATAVERCAD